jgi:tetratricopeptide (TPR) repeat protein
MKNLLYLLFLFLLPQLTFAQTKSLIKALKEQATDEKTEEVNRIAALNQLTTIYYDKNIKRAKTYCNDALKLAQKDSSSVGMCHVYNNQAMLSFGSGEYEFAISQTIQAIKIANNINRQALLATSYARLSLIYAIKGYSYKAIKYNIRAIEIGEKIGNEQSMARGNYLIGKAFLNLDNVPKASFYFSKSIAYFGKQSDKALLALVKMHIGQIYIDKDQFEAAYASIQVGLELSKKQSNLRGLAYGNYSLGKLYLKQQLYDESTASFKTALAACRKLEDRIGEALSLQGLSKVKMEQGHFKDAILNLNQALSIAKKARAKVPAQWFYRDLSDAYVRMGDYQSAMPYYRKYNTLKDSILSKDKNRDIAEIETKYQAERLARENEELLDTAKIFRITIDSSYALLEIQKFKNSQNSYVIVGLISGLLLMVIIGLLVFRQDKLKTQIRETELEQRALRSQMNPHFMFNSLNSIQSLIATDNNAEASIYLAKFSRLMRRILQNSRQAYVPLRQEIEFLDNYIELEQRRFKQAFDYILDEEKIEDTHFVMIPPLVIQPFIENAIIHGLLPKAEKGTLLVTFEDYNTTLIKCTITDDGIGRVAAAAFKTDENQESLGIKITEQRLKYLTVKQKITEPFIKVIDLKDKNGKATGTKIELLLPIKYKT